MNADSPETPKIEFNYGLFFAITSIWFILGSISYALYLLSQHGQKIGNSHEVLDRVVVLLTICFFIFALFFPESKVVTLASIPKFKVDSRNLIFLCALIGILGIPQILYSARDQWVGIGPIAAIGAMLLANAKWFYHQLLYQRIFKLCATVFIFVTYLPSHFQFFTDVSDRYHNLLLVNDDFSKLAISGYEGQYSAIYSSLGAEFAQLGITLPPSDSYTQVELVFIVRVILSVIFTLLIVLSISKLLSKPSKWMAWLVVPFMHSNSFFSLQGSLNEQLNLTSNRLLGFSILLLIMVFIRNPLIQVAIAFPVIFLSIQNNLEFGLILGFAFVLVQLTVFDSAGVRRTLFVISCITLALIVKNAALLFEGEITQSIGAIADFAGGYAGGPVSPIGPQLWIFSLSTALLLNFVLVARQGLERELARVGVFSCSFTVLCSIYFSNISSLAVQLQSSLVGLTVAILSWIILVSRLDSHTPPAFQSIGSIRLTRFFIAIPLVLSITNNGFATNLDRLASEDGGAMSVIEATQNRIFVLIDRNQVTKSELGLVLEFANVHSFIAQVPTLIPLTDPIFRSNPTIPCSSELKKLIVQDNLLETLSCRFTILDRHQNLVLVGT